MAFKVPSAAGADTQATAYTSVGQAQAMLARVWPHALLGLWALLGVAALLSIGLFPDEAYYWVWSQRLQSGYFDHAPLVAWAIRPFTALFGDAVWAIRLPAVLAVTVGGYLAWRMAGEVYASRRAAVLALLVWTSLPLVQVGLHVITPDSPLVLFGWLTYYLLWRALASGACGWWLAAGAAAGLAMLGKYTAVLLPVAVLLGLATAPPGRRRLRGKCFWLAALVAALVCAPVVVWNWANDWVSFAFQLGHGVKKAAAGDPLGLLGDYLAGQLVVVLPWTFIAMLVAAARPAPVVPAAAALLPVLRAGFWLPLALFAAAAMTGGDEANWPALAYLPGTLLLAGTLARWSELAAARRRTVTALVALAYLVALLFTLLARYPAVWMDRLPPHWRPQQRSQLTHTYGWEAVGAELRRQLAALPDGATCRVLGDRHQTAAMLAFVLGDARRATSAFGSRRSQYDLWDPDHQGCLYVAVPRRGNPRARVRLGPTGVWERVALLVVHNPDHTERRVGFYRPRASAGRL